MEKRDENFSEVEKKLKLSFLQICEETSKFHTGSKQFPKEKFTLIPKTSYVPSTLNSVSHIFFPDRVVNRENVEINFSVEEIEIQQKRTKEAMKILKKIDPNSINVEASSSSKEISQNSEIFTESAMSENSSKGKI